MLVFAAAICLFILLLRNVVIVSVLSNFVILSTMKSFSMLSNHSITLLFGSGLLVLAPSLTFLKCFRLLRLSLQIYLCKYFSLQCQGTKKKSFD